MVARIQTTLMTITQILVGKTKQRTNLFPKIMKFRRSLRLTENRTTWKVKAEIVKSKKKIQIDKIFKEMPKTRVRTKLNQWHKREIKRYKLKTILNKMFLSQCKSKMKTLIYTSLYILKKIPRSRVQFPIRVRTSLRKLHGLYTLTTTIKIHWVRKCCLKPKTMKLRCKKRVMRKYRIRKYKRCPCKGQESSRFIKKCFIWKKKSEVTRHQITKTKKVKRYPGKRLKKSRTIRIKLSHLIQYG